MSKADALHDVIIVGAGIIGLSIAHYLQNEGRKVTLVDRKGIAQEASYGNAAAFAVTDLLPLASPGMLLKAPKWLIDPLGPLSIRTSYLPKITPFLLKFFRASWPDQYARSVEAQAEMMNLARAEIAKISQMPKMGNQIRSDGALHLYETEADAKANAENDRTRQEHGIPFRHVKGDELAELQPGLSPHIKSATFLPSWQTVNDPYLWAMSVWDMVRSDGGELIEGEVVDTNSAGEITLADGQKLKGNNLIIAAGAWSHRLTEKLGDKIPLETERGYNTTLPVDSFDLKRQLMFGSHGFVMTPLSTGIRVGGAVEFAGLEAEPNYKRSEIMLQKAKKFLPDLSTTGGTQWMGFRPSLPDTLPAIGHASASTKITYAFGHGHLGLTQSLATAKLVADLVAGRTPTINMTPFNPSRF
ncbi:NAD(P)/FAD-dependent oxidoreductase [Maritalea porphyrae]|uniref:NAD(P)/FAD-dependent oxidoreductase n=1 Tax=Maritalea porphyrae TaxID=880732 RepID=UPI0022AEC07B|nr:FAD-binding oxidoreductase [Maritalea porphyrae]MCZ4271080.1 FAD-binding oxidoreductase [Maritalea porphyrae]